MAVRTTIIATLLIAPAPLLAQDICQGFGPQAPRDIAEAAGANTQTFAASPDYSQMNLCNIHTHTNAEHKGPGFSIFAGAEKHGGYKCNASQDLTEAELAPLDGEMTYEGVVPGDTIEVHWVYSSCEVAPGESLAACSSDTCVNPQLRVESQVFLVVNDPDALNFMDFAWPGAQSGDLYQAKALPENTGTPVVFPGSTTGDKYTQTACSPFQVTWSVRPDCAKLNIASLNEWAETDTVFNEKHSHGVRQLVTAPELLAPIN